MRSKLTMRKLPRYEALLFLVLTALLILSISPAKAQTNYATIPDDYEGNGWNIGSAMTTGAINYPVTFDSYTCVELLKNPQYPVGGPCNREMDSFWYLVSPGDILTYRAWIWTNASAFGDSITTDGARIGMDFYGLLGEGIGRINEVGGANGEADWVESGYNYDYPNQYEVVPWNSGTWVQLELNFTVPEYYHADAWGSYSAGSHVIPCAFTAWVIITSVNSAAETGAIYFRDSELYINEEPLPTPEATPTFAATPRPAFPSSTTSAAPYVPPSTSLGEGSGFDSLIGLCAVLAVFAIIIWPFIPKNRRPF